MGISRGKKLFFVILAVFFSLSLVSAALTSLEQVSSPESDIQGILNINKISDISKQINGTFSLTNAGSINLTNISLSASGEFSVGLLPSSTLNSLAPGETSQIFTVYPTDFIALDSLLFGRHYVNVQAQTGDISDSKNFTFAKTFCLKEEVGNLQINHVDINSNGADDLIWVLRDRVEVSVTVENTGDSDISGVYLQLGLFDSSGRNRVSHLDFDDSHQEKISLGTIHGGDDKMASFTFRVPVDTNIDAYKLVVKAYKSGHESEQCADLSSDFNQIFYQDITIEAETRNDHQIVIDDISINPEKVTCGDEVSSSFNVFNIGDDIQDQVLVKINNSELNLSKEVIFSNELRQGEGATGAFNFLIPFGIQTGNYSLQFKTYYDYRNGVYREESADSWFNNIEITGCQICPSDLNSDGEVNNADINVLLGHWNLPGASDLNHDGTTNSADLAQLLGSWGQCR